MIKRFNYILLTLLVLSLSTTYAFSQTIPLVSKVPFKDGEHISYSIYYNWGLIWKKAAEGKLHVKKTVFRGQPAYRMQLACRTLRFVDRVYPVRDTLVAYATPGVKPLYYAKLTHESDYEAQDYLTYQYGKEQIEGLIKLVRRNREPLYDTIRTVEQPFDMLSVFYYMRTIDFSKLMVDQIIDIPIITGKRIITMQMTFNGEGPIKLHNDKVFEAYRVDLSFINDKNLKEEDPPIEVWLSRDDRKIPIKMQGKLPIGYLQTEYDGE